MLTKYRGVILGLAYADALGAGYEFFKGKIGEDEVIDFIEIPKRIQLLYLPILKK